MDAAAEAGLSPAKPDVHLGPNKITQAKQVGASIGLPPKSPHSKPGTSLAHSPAQQKHDSSEQSANPSVRAKRDLSSLMEATDGKGSGPAQPSPYSTPTKPAKRAKTSRAQSASPSGPSATPEEFLQKLSAFVEEMGGELEKGWDVDVRYFFDCVVSQCCFITLLAHICSSTFLGPCFLVYIWLHELVSESYIVLHSKCGCTTMCASFLAKRDCTVQVHCVTAEQKLMPCRI